MVRRQWLWLFIWIFIFFSIFCIWSKLDSYKKGLLADNTTLVDHNETNITTPHPKPRAIIKDMSLTLVKKGEHISIAGNVPNRQTKDEILDSYKEIFLDVNASMMTIDKDTKEDLFGIDLLTNLAEDFSHFNNGVIKFDTKHIEINGTTDESIAKASINKKIKLLQERGIDSVANVIVLGTQDSSKSDTELDNSSQDQDIEKSSIKQEDNITNENNSSQESQLLVQEKLNDLLKDKKIHFLYAKDILTKDSKSILDSIAKILNKNSDTIIEIGGHTDSSGDKYRNLKLSTRRAQSVKRYLILKGVKEDRLKTVGYGSSKPLVKNNTAKNRKKNRRVEFKVVGEKK